jgi:hypothetical protein
MIFSSVHEGRHMDKTRKFKRITAPHIFALLALQATTIEFAFAQRGVLPGEMRPSSGCVVRNGVRVCDTTGAAGGARIAPAGPDVRDHRSQGQIRDHRPKSVSKPRRPIQNMKCIIKIGGKKICVPTSGSNVIKGGL